MTNNHQINDLSNRILSLEERSAKEPRLSEGLAVIEERLKNIEKVLEKHIADDHIVQATTASTLKDIERKLDAFLELRNKGMGVLWVLSGFAALVALAYSDIIRFLRTFFHG